MDINSSAIVSKQERDTLKEIIFARATERTKALQQDTENQYTDRVQYDVMDIAKASFSAEKNPFSMGISPITTNTDSEKADTSEIIEEPKDDEYAGIGFEIKEHKTILHNKIDLEESFVQSEITKNMIDARSHLENRKSFIGALNFLNSQATISLVNKKNGKFEANV